MKIFEQLTWPRALMLSLVIAVSAGSFVAVNNANQIASYFYAPAPAPLTSLSVEGQALVTQLMRKYPENAAYITVLRLDFARNTRVPIFRAFNDPEVKAIIMGRLKGGDGALPIFLKDDVSNNNQMIGVIQGEIICSDFAAGGLARVWPDLKTKFLTSCRLPVPPAFGGNGAKGYIVLHLNKALENSYEMETLKLDLLGLALALNLSDLGGSNPK